MSLVATGQHGVWVVLGHPGLCPCGYSSVGPVRLSGLPGAGEPVIRYCVRGRGEVRHPQSPPWAGHMVSCVHRDS
eukprot:1789071-Pyramimonas_sp.AAC.1